MEQDRKSVEKKPWRRSRKGIFTSYETTESEMIDHAQENPKKKTLPEEKVPSDEFDKIMSIMNERKIELNVYKELRVRDRQRQYQRFMKKPVVVGMLVLVLIGGTSMGVSAKKAYDFRMRERDVGKSEIVWNNDDTVLLSEDKLDEAYLSIEKELGIKPLKLKSKPFDLKFESVRIDGGNAIIKFKDANGNRIYYQQSKKADVTSKSIISDRNEKKNIYNMWLDSYISVSGDKLRDGSIEYSASFRINGVSCCLEGIMKEADFINIVENLNY